jgi:hypothetical protein
VTISRVGAATGTTTCTVPTHSIGDLIVISAFRSGSVTAPTLGAGYTSITTGTSANLCRPNLAYKVATATNDSSGTWTNATALTCVVYTSDQIASGGAIGVGGFGISNGATNTLTYNTLTMTDTSGTSWVAGFVGHKSTDQALSTHAPTGMTAITGSSLTNTAAVCAYDTNAGVTSWASTNVTVTGTAAGWDTQTLEILEIQAPAAPVSIPLVQWAYFQSNQNFETGNAFKYPLPNPTLTGNMLVLVLNYAQSVSRTVTITDDAGNSWSGTPDVTTSDTTNGVTTSIFHLANCLAGTSLLTVTFDAAILGVQAAVAEFYNIATTSPLDGSAAANLLTGSTIQSGSFSTTVDNDLILQFAIDSNGGTNYGDSQGITNIIQDSGYRPMAFDFHLGGALQATIQATHGATNPKLIYTAPAGQSYNSATIAFKRDLTKGTAPAGTGIRIVGIMHGRIPNTAGTANYTIKLCSQGNLVALTTAYNVNELAINSASDNIDGAWTVKTNAADAQGAYRENTTDGYNRKVTLNLTNGSGGNMQFLFYDITGAAASSFDTATFASGGSFGPGSNSNAPSITPTTSNGLILTAITFNTGPPDSVTPGTFDCIFYTGYTDLAPADSGDGYAHYYNPNTSAVNFAWHDTVATTGWNAIAMAFKAASVSAAIEAIGSPIFRVRPRAWS